MKRCLLVGILTTIFSSPVTAQEELAQLGTLQGVTVTATRNARDTFDVPETVTVISNEQMLRNQVDNIADVLEDTPGVAIAGGPRNIGTRFNIRGLDDSRVLFLLDGARQDFNRAHNSRIFIDPELLRQVEVVRGPASAIWGSGALGGVIAFQTKDAADLLRPGQQIGGKIKGGYRSADDQGLANGSIYGVLGDTFDYLLDFKYRNAGDIRLGDGTNLKNSAFESYAGMVKFNWSPIQNHHLMFSAQTFDQKGGIPSNPQILSTPDNLVDRETEQRNFTWRYRYDNADNLYLDPEILVFHNITKSDETRRMDGRRDFTDFTTTGINARNTTQFNWGEDDLIEQALTYGVDYHHNKARAKRDGMPRDSFPDAKTDVVGIYLQDEITIWDRLIITPGVRWDYFESRNNTSSGVGNNRDDEVSFKIGGVFKVTEWLSVVAAYNEAFRAPNLSELYTIGTHFSCGPGCENIFVPNPGLKPEKAFNREFGIRMQKQDLLLVGDNIRFRGTYFHNRVNNFIDLLVTFQPFPVSGNPGPGGVTTSSNVRKARFEGFEVEFNYEAKYGYAGLSYVQTRGDNLTDGGAISNVQPDKWIVRAGLQWPKYNVSVGWRGSIVDAQSRVPDGVDQTAGYTIHDLMLNWSPKQGYFKHIRVDLGIDNVTDEDYRRHLTVLKQTGRNYKASVRYQF